MFRFLAYVLEVAKKTWPLVVSDPGYFFKVAKTMFYLKNLPCKIQFVVMDECGDIDSVDK